MSHNIIQRSGSSQLIAALLFLILSIGPFLPQVAEAASVPSILSYQGRLTDSSGNLLGGSGTTYYFKFSIWDSATVGGGNRLWPASAPTATTANVRQGVFTVNIGDTTNGYPDALDYAFDSTTVYLQVEASSNGSAFETLSPRHQITSAAFSQVAGAVRGTGQSSIGTATPEALSVLTVVATTSNTTALTIKGASSQSASLFSILNSGGSSLLSVNSSGSLILGSLNGPLHAQNGVVSATTSVLAIYGGTGHTSYTVGDILYASAAGALTKLPVGNTGEVLKVSGGVPTWASDATGSGGAGAWATTSNSLAVHPSDTTDVIIIGSTATSTTGNIFEVVGNSLFRSALTAYGTITGPTFSATSTTATSTFAGGLDVKAINQTGTASSTFANGIQLSSGCFRMPDGSCVGAAGATTLDGLTDVDTTGVAYGGLIFYNGSTWEDLATTSLDLFATGLGASDFGDWTCNGTTCSLDADTVADSEIDYANVTLADFTNDADYVKWANATTSLWQSAGLLSTASSTINGTFVVTGNATMTKATTTSFAITSLASTLLATNANGSVVATSTISTNYLSGSLGTINSTAFNKGDSIVITAASSTLLANTNTWTGANIFAASTTIGNGAQAGGLTISGGATTTGNTVLQGTLTATGGLTSLSNLLLTGSTTLQNFTFANATGSRATTTSFAISSISSGSLLKATTGGALIAAVAGTDFANFAYPFPAAATTTTLTFSTGLLSVGSTTLNGNATTSGMHGVGSLYINGERFTDLTGSGHTISSGALTVDDVTPSMLQSADFGEFTCNGTTCSLDSDTVAESELDLTAVTLADFTNDADYVKWASATTSLWQSAGLMSTASSTINGTFVITGNATMTRATTTSFAISSITSGSLLKTTTGGALVAAVAGTDFLSTIGFGKTFEQGTNTFSQSMLSPTTTTLNLHIGGVGTSTFAGGIEAWRQIAAPYFHATSTTATSTLPLLSVQTSANFFGTFGNSLDDFCQGITGGSGLCDGVDGTGGGNGLATSTDIADTWIIYGTSVSDVGAESAFTYDDATNKFTVVHASTTNVTASYASSTIYYGAGLANCNTGNMLTWTDGRFGCEDDTSGGGASFGQAWEITGTYLTPTSTVQSIIAAASSTIGSGAQAGGLTISGGATTTGNLLVQGGATTTNLAITGVTSALLTTNSSGSVVATTSLGMNLVNTAVNTFINASSTIPKTYTANAFTALQTLTNSSTTVASFEYASSTLWFGGGLLTNCDTSQFLQWTSGRFGCGTPSGGGASAFDFAPNYGVLTAATSSPISAQAGIFASSTSHFATLDFNSATSTGLSYFNSGLIASASTTIGSGAQIGGLTISGGATTTGNLFVQGSATTTSLAITSLASTLLATNAQGSVVATSTISTNYLSGSLGTINSTAFNKGDSIVITAASSTLLANTNTWTGLNVFAASTTIGNGAQAGGLTISGGATTTGNTVLQGTLSATGGLTSLSNLLLSGSTTLLNYTFANATGSAATTTSFAISSISSGSLLKATTNGALIAAVAGTDFANFAYPFPAAATTTTLTFSTGLLSVGSTTINGNATTSGMHSVGSLSINSERFTDLSGAGLVFSSGALTVNDVTAAMLNSEDFGEFTCNGTTCVLDAESQALAEASDVTITAAAFGDILMHNGTAWVDTATSTLFSSSVQFATWLSDETGSGSVVFGTSPTLTTPTVNTSLTVTDDDWIGLSASAARIEYDDLTRDEINLLDANVGIGTTSPWALLSLHSFDGSTNTMLFQISSSTASATTSLFSVDRTGLTTIGDSTGTGDANFQFASDANAWSVGYNSSNKSFNIASSTNFTASVALTILKNNLNLGIGSTTPWRTLSVNGTVGFDGLSVNTGGVTAALCLDSNNQVTRNTDNETCVASSERYKMNIETLAASSSLSIIDQLRPVSFEFKSATGTVHYGFIAEEIEKINPLLVSYNDEGLPQSVRYIEIVPILTQALQEIHRNLGTIASTTENPTPESTSFAEGFFSNVFKRLSLWFADTTNGITDFFARKVHTNELCIGEAGDERCLTKVDIDALMAGAASSQGGATPAPEPEPKPVPEESGPDQNPAPEPELEAPPAENPPAEETPPVEETPIVEPESMPESGSESAPAPAPTPEPEVASEPPASP